MGGVAPFFGGEAARRNAPGGTVDRHKRAAAVRNMQRAADAQRQAAASARERAAEAASENVMRKRRQNVSNLLYEQPSSDSTGVKLLGG